MVRVAGIDHVCLGSDFDGAPMMPVGLEDASKLPALTARLRARGWAPQDIRKLLGENLLRVLAANEGK
jgi:membrane dipeptidase